MRHFLQLSYVKTVFGGLVAFVAVIAGVYVGSAITNSGPSNTKSSTGDKYTLEGQPIRMPADYMPAFGLGDAFPMVDCERIDGSAHGFQEVLLGKKTVLLFVHTDCQACLRLLNDWDLWAKLNRRVDIQMVLCMGQQRDEIPTDFWDKYIDYDVLFVNRRTLKSDFNLAVWPTIVCTDQYGLITALQVGYEDVFSEDVARSLR